ncbi:MAG TPA: hypothetical protein VF117_09850, partial [Gammaproteobacteria bacterium]
EYEGVTAIEKFKARFRWAMALLFAALFLVFSISLMVLAIYYLILAFGSDDMISGIIRSINISFISLATFELGIGISKEYSPRREQEDIFFVVRRMVMRFVSVACIALVLEGLVMVIKYSQLDLAGNLSYPVAILGAAGVLLLALGAFLALTRSDGHQVVEKGGQDAG